MLAIKLALKNLLGAGLRTWLNVSVLSLAFVVMVFYNGMLDGWNRQAINDTKAWEVGNGQLWHPAYDVYDPLSFQDAHALVEDKVEALVKEGVLLPVLLVPASAYPKGRMMNVVLKGIDPHQRVLKLPVQRLVGYEDETPAIIGKRMAKASGLQTGDRVLIRWRDANGTFDAIEVVIADVFQTNVPTVDLGTFWLPLNKLQQMTGMQNEATLLVASDGYQGGDINQWQFKDTRYLLHEFEELMKQKKAGSSIIYGLLMAIALLAIFDTQVLSIFRRQREIGTYIAMGMTRRQVVWIFTVEGSAHSLLALVVAAVYGIPLMVWMNYHGIPMPEMVDETGIAIAHSIIPVYSFGMVATSIALVVISATIVSYFPARRISKMNPTDALKGKLQ
jgi:ABC-type lipoprotein release transport system permease subunit